MEKDYAIDALKYNLPLMPYYLSMILLNHSDRLMIQKIDGYEDAALYSVSYSAAMVIFVISGALNLSLQAWLFKELKLNDSSKDKSRLITVGNNYSCFLCYCGNCDGSRNYFDFRGKKIFRGNMGYAAISNQCYCYVYISNNM